MKNKTFTLIILGLMMHCSTCWAQNPFPLPYYTGFDNPAEKFGWTEYRLGATNEFYQWEYSTFAPFSAPECLNHNYPVGGTEQTDDWFVSPVFDFSEGATIDSLRYAFSGFGAPMDGDTIGVYLLNGSPDPAVAEVVAMLYSFSDSTYINDNAWRKTEPFDIPPIIGESYIAFRYSTEVNWLDVKFDNLSISEGTTGLDDLALLEAKIKVYPNPSKEFLTLDVSNNLRLDRIVLVNSTGAAVKSFNYTKRQFNITELASGIYFLRLFTSQGVLSKKVVLD